jgi:hypothetical protein
LPPFLVFETKIGCEINRLFLHGVGTGRMLAATIVFQWPMLRNANLKPFWWICQLGSRKRRFAGRVVNCPRWYGPLWPTGGPCCWSS